MRKEKFWIVLSLALILTGIGLLAIYSAGGKDYLFRQLIWVFISLIAFYLTYRTEKRFLIGLSPFFYLFSLLLLLALLFFQKSPVRRWFTIGPFSFQPSELTKVFVILFLARILSQKRKFSFSFPSLLFPIFIIALPLLLIFIQPDLGSAFSLLSPFALILYFKGLRPYELVLLFSPLFSFLFGLSFLTWVIYFFALAFFLLRRANLAQFFLALGLNSLIGLTTPVFFNNLKDYQRERLVVFFSPSLDLKGSGWSAFQSKVAIGSGMVFGRGYLKGKMARLEFIPNRHTDFIFTTIGEEFGLLGGLVLLTIFLLFLYHLLNLNRGLHDEIGQLVIAGATGFFLYHIVVNLGMVLGVLPVTGLTLPFISYGGSSLFANFLLLGLVLNFALREE